MNENIKVMCLELAELALETEWIYIHVSNFCLLISNYDEKINSLYYDNIFFTDEDAEQRIKKALDYVRNLGGNKDV